MSNSCFVRRLAAAFIVILITTPTPAKDGKELPILGKVITFAPMQNKLLMEGGRTTRPEREFTGFAIVNAGDGKVIGVIQDEGRAKRQAPLFSPDGASLVTVSGTIKLWYTSTAKPRKELEVLKSPSAVAFSSDGKMLAVVGHIDDFEAPLALKAVDFPSGKDRWMVPLSKTGDRTAQLASSKNGALLVGQYGAWKLVDFETGNVEKMFENKNFQDARFADGSLHLCHDAKRFVHTTRDFVNVWEIDGPKKLLTLTDKNAGMVSKFVAGDDRHSDILIMGTRDGVLRVLNVSTLKVTDFGDKHQAAITAIDASATKRTAVTGSEDFRIKVWDLDTTQLLDTLLEDKLRVSSVAISSDGQRIAGCYGKDQFGNGPVRIWNLK